MTRTAKAGKSAPQETRMVELVFPEQTNHYGTMYGGFALSMMDKAAYIAATRYCRKDLVTVATDEITFRKPIKQGDIVELVAKVVKQGRTSITVEVEIFSEGLLTGRRHSCAVGHFVFVAVSRHGKPTAITQK